MAVKGQVSTESATRMPRSHGINTCCPNSGDGTLVSSGTITVWVTICCTPPPPDAGNVYASVAPDPSPRLAGWLVYRLLAFLWAVLRLLRLTSPGTASTTRFDLGNNCWLYQFPPVPGAASSAHPNGSGNQLIVQYTDASGTSYPPEYFPFTGFNDYGCDCGSGPGNQSGSGCTGSGGDSPDYLALRMTFPAAFQIEMSGLEGPWAVWNGVHILTCSHPASLTWDNGPEGKTPRRVMMKHCARTQTFTLTLGGPETSLKARAPITTPFASLIFALEAVPHQHAKARIVATGAHK